MWEEAKGNNDYEAFKPYLKDVIEYTKKYYGYLKMVRIYMILCLIVMKKG